MWADSPGGNAKYIAQLAIDNGVTFDPAKAMSALTDLYDAASEVAGGRTTAELLASRGITLKGISDSALKRMSDAIANGLSNGDTHTQIALALDAITLDPARSDVIAITEANRSYNDAFVQTIADAGGTQFEWLTDEDPCPECEELAGLHDIGDDPPPDHPRCRCVAVAPSG